MNDEQKKRAMQIWQKYCAGGEHIINASKEYTQQELDLDRRKTIPEVLTVIQNYLTGKSQLDEFKTRIDSINKRNRLWGFKGINGQMFFNMLTKTSMAGGKINELEKLLKHSLPLPASLPQAAQTLEDFFQSTKGLAKYVEDRRAAPKTGAIPFFLSYFWQIQAPDQYPVYYTSMLATLGEYNLWQPSEKIGESYVAFYELNHELLSLFRQASGRNLTLWDVEHAFWYVAQPQESPVALTKKPVTTGSTQTGKVGFEVELPDSYIPSVVGILPRLAFNDPELAKLC